MAVEAARGCGFRSIGGLYLVSGQLTAKCDRLPFELVICPCCGHGIKFSRGWTWIEPALLFEGDHLPKEQCYCFQERPNLHKANLASDNQHITGFEPVANCPACSPVTFFKESEALQEKAGLLWVGQSHYQTTSEFQVEATEMGVSRRIHKVPRGFKVGKTYVFLAHIAALTTRANGFMFDFEPEPVPGIFAGFLPERIERIVKQSEFDLFKRMREILSPDPPFNDNYGKNEIARLSQEVAAWPEPKITAGQAFEIFNRLDSDVKKGITLVAVPDDDPDHQPKGKKK